MRIFFALDLTPTAKLEIASWRDRSFRELAAGGRARPVPPGNFHVTLAFIGDVAQYKLESLCNSVEYSLGSKSMGTCEVAFNELGYWQRQGILWLGPKHCPAQLQQLADRLKGLCARAGGKRDNKVFAPHITLFRGCKLPPPTSLEPPDFTLQFGDFTLFESRQGKRGVSYYPLQHWSL
jgi:2'-5' RNA ligase